MASFSTTNPSDFVDAAACGDLDSIKGYLADSSYPATMINHVDKDGRSAFHYSCLNDDVPLLKTLLADDRVDVVLTSPKGDTALHMASLYAALEAMKLLFSDGRVDVNAQNKYGETALHLAAGSGDKGASKAAQLLLSMGNASLTVRDKWGRGPVDVSYDNAENSLVKTLTTYLEENKDIKEEVERITKEYKEESEKPVYSDTANKNAKAAILKGLGGGVPGLLGGIGGIKLKKTVTKEKTMFSKTEGKAGTAGVGSKTATELSDGRKALSKLIDFPGDVEEIKTHLEKPEEVDPNGPDAYGLCAIHKFASWNKTVLLELLIPKLEPALINTPDKEGKTALHWAVEMASVAAVKCLVANGADVEAKDGKGRTVGFILENAGESGIIERLKKAVKGE
mmetsp:Transcript_17090/g.35186  ORF Transcript_17090/g.35186 Transcript_17090/m.35186 type:complete len:396 (-) Transcript_17090:49-1236(-)